MSGIWWRRVAATACRVAAAVLEGQPLAFGVFAGVVVVVGLVVMWGLG